MKTVPVKTAVAKLVAARLAALVADPTYAPGKPVPWTVPNKHAPWA